MDDEAINKWANAYIQAQKAYGLNTKHPQWWAIEKFMEVGENNTSANEALRAIVAVLKLNPTNKILEILTAGPLEGLIEEYGSEVIEEIEDLAHQMPEFKNLLGGVWECGHPKIWARILNCRDETQSQ